MSHPCSHFKYMFCYSVIAGAHPTLMDTGSEGDLNSVEEGREMQTAAKEEKRLETEYKEGVKVKAEQRDHERAKTTRGKDSKRSNFIRIFAGTGMY